MLRQQALRLLRVQSHNLGAAAAAQQAQAHVQQLGASFSTATVNSNHNQTNAGGRFSGLFGATAAAVMAAIGYTSSTQPAHADASAAAPAQVATPDPYQRPTELHGVPKEITLWQYQVCPYCCKVKAFLDYHKIPYTVIEVNPLTKSELSWSTYKKVPVIKMEQEVVVDSSAIMSRLAAEVEAVSSSQEASAAAAKKLSGKAAAAAAAEAAAAAAAVAAAREDEAKWRKWVDDRFVKVITANIYRSWDESWATFRYITEHTTWPWASREVARASGAVLMWQIGKRMPAKYGIEGDLREALYNDCNTLVDALGAKPFLGGDKPNLADLSVFGVLEAVKTTPTFSDALANSRIEPWYRRMQQAVGASARVNP